MEDTMTTHRTRSRVSCAAALALALTLGGCASTGARYSPLGTTSTARPAFPGDPEGSAADAPASVTIQFDNQGDDAVRVYLLNEKQQWLLGRVERGANARLRVPRAALTDDAAWMRLNVLPADPATVRGSEARAAMTTEPVAVIVSQRWTFSRSFAGGQLTSLPLARATTAPR
jgi:hypothetical protein